jgi:site-specific DNA-cytosine methylase
VAEMMGFPTDWTISPFQSGETKAIKAYGNAVVPQLILPIFQTIEKLHREKNT